MCNYPSAESCKLFFQVGDKTLYRYIKRNYGLTFDQFRERYMLQTRHALIQTALSKALQKGSDRMLELCLKNFCGWDGTGQTIAVSQPVIQLRYSLDTPAHTIPAIDVTPAKDPTE